LSKYKPYLLATYLLNASTTHHSFEIFSVLYFNKDDKVRNVKRNQAVLLQIEKIMQTCLLCLVNTSTFPPTKGQPKFGMLYETSNYMFNMHIYIYICFILLLLYILYSC